MEADFTKSLEQLQIKKKAIKDLSKECDAIVELNDKISSVSDQIHDLVDRVGQQRNFIEGTCDHLRSSFQTLSQTSRMLDVINDFRKLNKICQRLHNHLGLPSSKAMDPSLIAPGTEGSKLKQDFSDIYKLYENALSKRLDLPYISYASKLEGLSE